MYVTKDSSDRKSIIVTVNKKYRVGLSLREIVKLCENRLIQTHRSCFVNMDRVRVVRKHDGIIEFDNGENIDLLSNMYKKGIGV